VRKRDWENSVRVYTDAAASLNDHCLGVIAEIKEAMHKEMLFTHCYAAKKLI